MQATPTTLSEREKALICEAVEAEPRRFIAPLELRSVAMIEALPYGGEKDLDAEEDITRVVSLVYRIKQELTAVGDGAA
jgi:hypothetical protein